MCFDENSSQARREREPEHPSADAGQAETAQRSQSIQQRERRVDGFRSRRFEPFELPVLDPAEAALRGSNA